MNAPNLKYTDRDVRENPGLYGVVVQYLEDYEGEFTFLVDCKMRITAGYDLSTGMVRGVLNCMRVDPRAPELPEPTNWESQGAEVIEMPKKKRRKFVPRDHLGYRYVDCPLKEAGIFHQHKRFDLFKVDGELVRTSGCSGLYRINREGRELPVKIHDEYFVKGKTYTTTLVHGVDHAFGRWLPPLHEYGWQTHIPDCRLHVRTLCKYPSWLTDPVLVTADDITEYNKNPIDKKGKIFTWEYCPRCFPERKAK